jgi:hypothetical protein
MTYAHNTYTLPRTLGQYLAVSTLTWQYRSVDNHMPPLLWPAQHSSDKFRFGVPGRHHVWQRRAIVHGRGCSPPCRSWFPWAAMSRTRALALCIHWAEYTQRGQRYRCTMKKNPAIGQRQTCTLKGTHAKRTTVECQEDEKSDIHTLEKLTQCTHIECMLHVSGFEFVPKQRGHTQLHATSVSEWFEIVEANSLWCCLDHLFTEKHACEPRETRLIYFQL